MNHRIFITGGAGYVGVMLAQKFAARADVEKIFCLDKEEIPDIFKGESKIEWLTMNTCDDWEVFVRKFAPDIVIHTAWQIREMYGKKELQWKWNVDGSDKVFDFAFSEPSVKRLIHFSTVASYSARKDNTLEHRFTEDEPFRESDYLYAIEKKVAEDHLKEKYEAARDRRGRAPNVFIIRPAAITGPRGRFMRIRFGLQSALSGQLTASPIHRMISAMVSFVPATKKWARQFVHEDDITDVVELLSFADVPDNSPASAKATAGKYEAFNICPPGDIVLAKDMARLVGKKVMPVTPLMVRFAFFIMWNLTRGRVPTSKGGWKSYSYPIIVDGSKITKMFGFKYKCDSKTAFSKIEGRYAKYVDNSRKGNPSGYSGKNI